MQTIKGIKRKLSYEETFNYLVEEYGSHEELWDNLKKDDEVFVQENENSELYLMKVELKEARHDIIIFKDNVSSISTGQFSPCYKVLKVLGYADK